MASVGGEELVPVEPTGVEDRSASQPSASSEAAAVQESSGGPVAPWLYALALAWWASSWNLGHSVLMAWLPIEPVWIGTGAVALCVVHRCGQRLPQRMASAIPLLLLVIGFVPGALRSSGEGYAPAKLATMAFVLLPVVCAAVLLLDSARARRAWLWAQVFVGSAVALAALRFHDTSQSAEPGRFALETLDTITTARFIGVAVVVFLLVGMGSMRNAWWALPLAAGGGIMLVHIGSRGPLIFALLTVVIVASVGRYFVSYGRTALLVGFAATGAAYLYAQFGGGLGGRRIVESVQSGLSDSARRDLLRDAIRLGTEQPMGIGWGDFAYDSRAGHDIANAQGVAYPHNVFAEALCEGGLLALLVLVIVVMLALRRLHRLSTDATDVVVLGTAIYWLLNAQVSSDFVGNRFMWIALACGLASFVARRSEGANSASRHVTPQPEGDGSARDERGMQEA